MPRFFVDSIGPEADFAILTGEQAAHAKVLRLGSPEKPPSSVTDRARIIRRRSLSWIRAA